MFAIDRPVLTDCLISFNCSVPHPYLLEDTGGPQPPPALKLGYICGQAGETFISVRLPLSSYGPEASRIDVSVPITLSTVPADGFLYANGGFLCKFFVLNFFFLFFFIKFHFSALLQPSIFL